MRAKYNILNIQLKFIQSNKKMELSVDQMKNLCNNDDLNPVNLVDPDAVVDNVLAILKYMENPEIMKLKRKNFNVFERHMEQKFPKFSDEFYFIFKKVIDDRTDTDLTPLFAMLKEIKLIKENKKNFETAEKDVVGGLCSKYVIKKQ